MTKAWFFGFLILLLASTLWIWLLEMERYSRLAFIMLWIAPALAGLVTSYLGPSSKMILGLSLSFPTALLAVTINSVAQLLGHLVDFPGLDGGAILFAIVLFFSAIAAGLGAVMGTGLSTRL